MMKLLRPDLTGKCCHHLFGQQIDIQDQTDMESSPTQEEEVLQKPSSNSELLVPGTYPVHAARAHPAAPRLALLLLPRLHSPHMPYLRQDLLLILWR